MVENGITTNDFEKKILDLLSKELLSVSQIAKKMVTIPDFGTNFDIKKEATPKK